MSVESELALTAHEADLDLLPLSADERRDHILEIVNARGRVRVRDLAELVRVTEPTIRKDITDLASQRLLRRIHGGALAIRPAYEPSVTARTHTNALGKCAIARACLAQVRDGDAIFIDSGSTMIALADAFRPDPALANPPAAPPANVNVLTNAVEVARILAPISTVRHTMLGGQYRAAGECLVGPLAIEALERFTLNIAFIGVTGLSDAGFTVADVSEAQLKAAAMERARRVIVPMDHTKVGSTGFIRVCETDRIDTVITDEPNEYLEQMCAEHDVELVLA